MMKKVILVLLLVFSFSCSKDEKDCCVNPIIELSGRFEHEIPNCDNSDNLEVNCTEWLEFVNDSVVDILYGGTDIVKRFSYTQGVDFISLEGPATSSFIPVFLIRDQSILERKDNGDIWKKK